MKEEKFGRECRMKLKNKIIKLSDLQINTENYRFEPLESEEEAIDYMVANQKQKLLNLALSITEKGFYPTEKPIVYPSPHQKGKYNVLEGNRRIIGLKLLNNPSLIRGQENSLLKNKFKKYNEKLKPKELINVPCLVCNDPKEVEYLIGLKHGYGINGVGIEGWDPIQKDRFKERTEGKSSIVLQAIKKMQSSNYFPEDLRGRLNQLKTTNLHRLLSDPDVRNFLGIDLEKGILISKIDEKEVMKGLAQIVKELLDKDFKVKKIYFKVDRKDFLEKFPKTSKPNKKIVSKKAWYFKDGVSPTPKKTSKTKPYPKERKTLIPKFFILKIKNSKVNNIYNELREIDVEKFPNSSAVLFRVFIELSLDEYLEGNNIKIANRDSKFRKKINEVANDLEKKGVDKHICKGIRTAANTKDDLLGVETLHAYVHNDKFSPLPKNLLTSWDNIQSFIEKIWGNIKQ